ncbi:MAG: hypothetical protein HYU36_06660 [Planctomycetes bacterium]|nr:hypothetical protein [Planctomycetota bacterium]
MSTRSSLLFLFLLQARASCASDFLCLQAENFEKVDAACRNFGGVAAVFFPKKESSIQTSVTIPAAVQAEVWARVYFPWAGQDSLSLQIAGQAFSVSARNEHSGGRWDAGNFQVWHWVRAGRTALPAGQHPLALKPVNGNEQRIDQVVLYWGTSPPWTQPWLAGDIDLSGPVLEWKKGPSLPILAHQLAVTDAGLENIGSHTVAVLRGDGDRLAARVQVRKAFSAQVWARVYFEAKNMFEGLSMEEMANNLYLSVDGELRRSVFEQNDRQWHWVSTDGPCDLQPGLHLVTLQKQGLPVKVDQVVLHAGGDEASQPWFESPAPPVLPFGFGEGVEVARGGNWRACGDGAAGTRLAFLGEQEGPVRYPVRIEFGRDIPRLDLVHIRGREVPASARAAVPAQQLSLWARNTGAVFRAEILYTDANGEAFLQPLHEAEAWSGWRLLSANIPLGAAPGAVFFDRTGYAIEVALTPPAAMGVAPAAHAAGVRSAGPGRDGRPDFPLEVRGLRILPSPGLQELTLGEPFFESPFQVRTRPAAPGDASVAQAERPSFQIEVINTREVPKNALVYYRFGELESDLLEASGREALYQAREVVVPGHGRAAVTVTHLDPRPGLYFLDCRAGHGKPCRRAFAVGPEWQERLAAWQRREETLAGACRFSPDGRDVRLQRPDASPLSAADVPSAYGADRGLVVLDDGLDVCSLEYALKRGYATPLAARGFDLSDEAGWPHADVPNSVLAIDPLLGRCQFAPARPGSLQLLASVQTGFGVPGPPVTVRGNFAYVGPGEGHYSIVDISSLGKPRVVASISSWYFSHRLFLTGPYGYFESSHRGLILVDDLSNPYQPGPLRNVRFDRARHGRLAHLFDAERVGYSMSAEPALYVFDFSDPLAPREIGRIPGVSGFVPAGGRALTHLGDAIRLLDLSRPAQPKLLPGGLPREKNEKGEPTSGLFAASPEHLAVRTGQRIDLYRCEGGRVFSAEKMASLTIPEGCGGHVFGAFHRGLFHLFDGCNGPGQYSIGARSARSRWFVFEFGPQKVERVGLYEHPWPSAFGNVTFTDTAACLSDYNYGLWTFDLSDPRRPRRVGGVATAGESDGLWLDGDIAYQWQTFGGAVFLIDVSRPETPRRVGEYWDGAWLPYGNTRRGNNTIAGRHGFLYVPRQDRGLVIADVREPASPKPLGEFPDEKGQPLPVSGSCIDVWGDSASVLARDRLVLYSLADAGKPALLSSLPVPVSDTLCYRGQRIYLGHAQGAFTLVDATDPAKPSVLATLDLKPYCTSPMSEVISGIAVSREHAYLTGRGLRGDGAMFLHIVDVRQPAAPRWVATVDPYPDLPASPCSLWGDFNQDLIVDGDYLFIGNYGQIECYDISEPERPRLHAVRHLGYQWSVGRKRGDHLFVPALSGLLVLEAPSSSQRPSGRVEARARFQPE